MRKTTNFFKRGLCIFLVAVTLSITVAGDYYEARYCEAAEAAGFIALIETILLSLGISCKTYDDLQRLSQAANYDFRQSLTEEEWEQIEAASFGDVIDVGKQGVADLWEKVKTRVKNLVSERTEARNFNRVETPSISDEVIDLQVQHGVITQSQLCNLWNNITIGSGNIALAGNLTTSGLLLVARKIDWTTGRMDFKLIYPYGTSSVKNEVLTSKSSNYYVEYSGNTVKLCTKSSGSVVTASKLNTYCISLSKNTADADHLTFDAGESSYVSGVNTLVGRRYSTSFDEWITSLSASDYQICAYSAVPVYSSFQDYVLTNTAITTFPLANSTYGDSNVAMDDTKPFTITDGSITQMIEEAINNAMAANPSITADEINDIVSTYVSEMTDTKESLDDTESYPSVAGSTWLEKIFKKVDKALDFNLSNVISKIVTFNADVKDKFDLWGRTVTTGLDEVVSAVRGIDVTVDLSNVLSGQTMANSYLSSLVDGTSALKEDAEDIADQLTVIEGGGGQPDPDNDPNENVDVWLPVIPTVLAIFKPILEFFGNPLSIITRHLSTLKSSLKDIHIGWQEWIKGTYDNVTGIFKEQLPQILQQLKLLVEGAGNLPLSIASEIASVLPGVLSEIEFKPIPIEFPDSLPQPEPVPTPEIEVNFPPIPDYMNILQQILAAIQSIFALNMPAIHSASLGLNGALDGVFPDLSALMALFDGFHFTNDYDYPVLKLQTPDIIRKAGFDNDYIVLINFADYATYCVWARKFVRFFIWIAFVYSIFGHFKVRLSVD